MAHYVARIVVEKVLPAEAGKYANDPGKPRQVEEVFSSVVKSDDIDKLTEKITAVVEAGL